MSHRCVRHPWPQAAYRISRAFRISCRRKGFRRAWRESKSTSRPKISRSSPIMSVQSYRFHWASEVKLTNRSTSLSGRKSSRTTDPNADSSAAFHLRQKSSSRLLEAGIFTRPLLASSILGALSHRSQKDVCATHREDRSALGTLELLLRPAQDFAC